MTRTTARLEALAAAKPYALVGGPFGSKLTSADYVDEGIPVIRGSNLNGGRYLDEEDFVYVSEQKMREDLFGNLAHPGDIVFTQRGTLGQVALIPDEARFDAYVISQSQMKLSVDPLKADSRFIYYYFSCRETVQRIINQNSSSGVPHINLTGLRHFIVPVPQLREQQRIADILSAYDDLIDNNRRRIALLEEAARMLYREWFVHFRFPGHEHVKITDGLPEGWEQRTLTELAEDVSYGFTASADPENDGPRFLRITDIVDGPISWPSVPRCSISPEKQERFLLASDDIVVARTGATTGWARRVGRQNEPALFASYLVRFRFSETYRPEIAAIYMQSDQYKAFVKGNLGGAAQPNAGAKVLGRASVPVAPSSLQRLFAETVGPMFDQIDVLMEQNQKLAHARDLLLPRLINGEIAI